MKIEPGRGRITGKRIDSTQYGHINEKDKNILNIETSMLLWQQKVRSLYKSVRYVIIIKDK